MKIHFYKYEGAGNDFILIDNRDGSITLSHEQIQVLCNRNIGIGADGLMLLEASDSLDFYMRYHNADGGEVAMCGNGGRCIALFAHHLGIGGVVKYFASFDGSHDAEILTSDDRKGDVRISLIDVSQITTGTRSAFLNSGVPHYISFVDAVSEVDVMLDGAAIRYIEKYAPSGGTNANFVEILGEGKLSVRTYERGVEGETLACGTGATASAMAVNHLYQPDITRFEIDVLGGKLTVSFDREKDSYSNVLLEGPARRVFEGTIELD